MTKFQEAIELYKSFMSDKLKMTDVNESILVKLAQMLGDSIFDADASLVACSDKGELKRVKELYLLGELKLTESPELDKAIKAVCEKMGTSNRKKFRVVFYYLLLQEFKLEGSFTGEKKSSKVTQAPKATTAKAEPKTEKTEKASVKVEVKTKTTTAKPATKTVEAEKEPVKTESKAKPKPASAKKEEKVKEEVLSSEPKTLIEKVDIFVNLIRDDLNFDDIHYDLLSNLVSTSGEASIVNTLFDDEYNYIKESFLKGRLGLSDNDNLDEAIYIVDTRMGDLPKHRPVFYYLLTKHLGREWVILEPTTANLF